MSGDGTVEMFGKVLCQKCSRHLSLHEVAHGQCRGCGAGIGHSGTNLGRGRTAVKDSAPLIGSFYRWHAK